MNNALGSLLALLVLPLEWGREAWRKNAPVRELRRLRRRGLLDGLDADDLARVIAIVYQRHGQEPPPAR